MVPLCQVKSFQIQGTGIEADHRRARKGNALKAADSIKPLQGGALPTSQNLGSSPSFGNPDSEDSFSGSGGNGRQSLVVAQKYRSERSCRRISANRKRVRKMVNIFFCLLVIIYD
jgi:hypothetical protein